MKPGRLIWMAPLLATLSTSACRERIYILPDSGLSTEVGTLLGPCYPNLTCNEGLSCLSELCVDQRDAGVERELSTTDTGDGPPPACTAPCVETIAGTGEPGAANGDALSAQFNHPAGVAVDSSGRIYVADRDNHRIRLIKDNVVSTFAGGVAGYRNSSSASARFHQPHGVGAFDNGAVLVADTANQKIRKIAGGTVTTLASNSGSSRPIRPVAIAIGIDGRGFVADAGRRQLLQVISTPAPFGMSHPFTLTGVAVGSEGRVFVIGNGGLSEVDASANRTIFRTSIPGLRDGRIQTALWNKPAGLAATNNGELLFCDSGNHRVRGVKDDMMFTVAGSERGFADGPAHLARFNVPQSLAISQQGDIYVADTSNHRIRVIRRAK